ncbi:hypothetical protein ES703_101858 [subsurface metagenome]
MLFNHREQVIRCHLHDGVIPFYGLKARLIDGHGANSRRTGGNDGPSDGVDIAAGAQVHHRVRAGINGNAQLFQFRIDITKVRGRADIGIDLGLQSLADAAGNQFLIMIDIGRYNYPPPGDTLPNKLRVKAFCLRHYFHLWRYNAFPGRFQLRHSFLHKVKTKGSGGSS